MTSCNCVRAAKKLSAMAGGADGEPASDGRMWECGWDGHERAQRERMARLPLWEKLAWLEEAQRVVFALGTRSPANRSSPPDSAATG